MGHRKGRPVHGWLIVDKTQGLTSTDVVARAKRLFDARKAGHAGTLDPLAKGILPVAFGEATKTVAYVMGGTKSYRFTIEWGKETDTDDAEGQVRSESGCRPTRDEIEIALDSFRGEIMQVPPQYSAIKVDGARAYDIAREGGQIELPARPVVIERLEVLDVLAKDECTLEVDCGKGTYVRAIARDLGRSLGCFGHIKALRRIRVGPFTEEDAISLDKLRELRNSASGREALEACMKTVEMALDDIPALSVSIADASRLKQGRAVLLRGRDAPILTGTVYAMSRGLIVAMGEVRRGELHPTRVFNI